MATGLRLNVEAASACDIEAWLGLAAEVGDLFGSDMAGDPIFRAMVERNISRSNAVCVRSAGEFAGGMIFGRNAIHWLGVRRAFHRRGFGTALVRHAITTSDGHVCVTTFGDDHPHRHACAARALYLRLGFVITGETAAPGVDGTSRVTLEWIKPRSAKA